MNLGRRGTASSLALDPGLLTGAMGMLLAGTSVASASLLIDQPMAPVQCLRYLVAGIALLVWQGVRSGRPPVPSLRQAGLLTVLAAIGMVGFTVAMVGSLRIGDPAFVGAVLGTEPVLLVLVSAIIARRHPRRIDLLAAAVVAAGSLVAHAGGGSSLASALLALVAVACEVVFSLLGGGLVADLGAVPVAGFGCLLAGLMFLPAAVADSPQLHLSAAGIGAIAWYAVPATAGAFALWFAGVARVGPATSAAVVGLAPIGNLLALAAFAPATLTMASCAGGVLAAAGATLARPSMPVEDHAPGRSTSCARRPRSGSRITERIRPD